MKKLLIQSKSLQTVYRIDAVRFSYDAITKTLGKMCFVKPQAVCV